VGSGHFLTEICMVEEISFSTWPWIPGSGRITAESAPWKGSSAIGEWRSHFFRLARRLSEERRGRRASFQ